MTKLYGLGGGTPMSQPEVARMMGLGSRENVRRHEARALRKIRMSPYIKEFAVYLDNPQLGLDNIFHMRTLYSESELNTYRRDFDEIATYARERK